MRHSASLAQRGGHWGGVVLVHWPMVVPAGMVQVWLVPQSAVVRQPAVQAAFSQMKPTWQSRSRVQVGGAWQVPLEPQMVVLPQAGTAHWLLLVQRVGHCGLQTPVAAVDGSL